MAPGWYMNKGGNWQERYLNLLDERDAWQKQFNQTQELFRRTLVRLSLAAEGRNLQLDQDLSDLRRAIKSNEPVDAALERLEATLLQQERQGIEPALPVLKASLSDLVMVLQQQASEPETKTQLKALAAGLKSDDIPDSRHWMETLVDLQQKTFEENRHRDRSKPSLLNRLLKRTAEPATDASHDLTAEETAGSDIEPAASVSAEEPLQPVNSDITASISDGFEHFVSKDEFLKIASRLEIMITDFIDVIEVTETMETRAKPLRQRIEQGLTWFELAPALEDMRDLAVEAYDQVNQKNHQYLQYLYQEIAQLMHMAGASLEGYRAQQSANQMFDRELQAQLYSIDKTVAAANDIGELKQEIESHLQAIREVMSDRAKIPDDSTVESKLESLEAQLRHAEAHSKAIKVELELQRKRATTDSLTALPNRDAYNERARFEWDRMKRYGHPLVLAVVDIDRFKQVNDKFGHQTGDRVLKMFSKTISQRLRSVDFIARYGGEEFVILLPETSLKAAEKLLDMIRESIANAPFRFKQEPLQVTLSMGIVQVKSEETVAQAFGRADHLLYQAKGAGRNRCMAQSD